MPEQKVRREPRLSVNALAQYVVAASPGRREKILKEQKYPPTFQVAWYQQATRAMVRYLLSDDRDTDILIAAAQRIGATPTASKNEQQRIGDNVAALTAFAACSSEITFDTLEVHPPPQQAIIEVEGVTVSVRPDAILSGQHRNSDCTGAVKLYLSKREPLNEAGAATVGSMVHLFMDSSRSEDVECNTRHITVVDVFARKCISAPRAVTRRRNEIQAACREIAHRWPAI